MEADVISEDVITVENIFWWRYPSVKLFAPQTVNMQDYTAATSGSIKSFFSLWLMLSSVVSRVNIESFLHIRSQALKRSISKVVAQTRLKEGWQGQKRVEGLEFRMKANQKKLGQNDVSGNDNVLCGRDLDLSRMEAFNLFDIEKKC